MRSIATTRRYELFIVLAAAAAYVTRRLNEMKENFNFDINWAKNNGVKNSTILRDLASFDYNQNVIFPTVVGAMLFMAAWYVFHYHAFPRIKEKKHDTNTILLIALTIGLTSASISLYGFFNREIMALPTVDGHQVGFQVVFLTIGNLFFSTCVALLVIGLYEAIAQAYYRTIELYEQKGESRYRTQQYVLLALAGGCLLLWVLVGRIANVVVDSRHIIHIQSFTIILISILFHFIFYKKWLPYLAKFWRETSKGLWKTLGIVVIYLLANLLLALIWTQAFYGEIYALNILYFLPSALGLATALVRQSLFRETHQLQTQVLQKTTELDTLRSQVNPHFLFNALNTLYAVALKETSEKTADGIQKLGDMMRFMLHENNQERIPLRKEIEYLHNFLDLQRMRLDEGHEIDIRVNIQEPERDRYLAPMLLNPFVENAFKHGISLRQPSWVYITLALDATKLYFKVHNSLHQKTGDDPEKNKPGIGLDNVRKRLELLYPDHHTLDIQATESDYFVSLALETEQPA